MAETSTSSFNEDIFFSTVRIVTNEGNIGTGFCFCDEDENGVDSVFVVTNRHMVEGHTGGRLFCHKGKNGAPAFEQPVQCDVRSWSEWFCHPDPQVDVAVLHGSAVVRNEEIFNRSISASLFLNDDQPHALGEVVFVGYPNGIFDAAHALPVARRGMIASFLNQDYNGRPCFLVDASVYGGSSGSPVFMLSSVLASKAPNSVSWGKRCYFIGIVAGTQVVPLQTVHTQTQSQPVPVEHLDLGVVFKARTIVETIEAWKRR